MTQLKPEVIAGHAVSVIQAAIDHPDNPAVLGRCVGDVMEVLTARRYTQRERSHHVGALIGVLAGAAAARHAGVEG